MLNTKRLNIIRPSERDTMCPHCHSNSLVILRYGRCKKIGSIFCSKCHKDKDYKSDDSDSE